MDNFFDCKNTIFMLCSIYLRSRRNFAHSITLLMIEHILVFLVKILTKWQNRESLKLFGAARSSQWSRVRRDFLKSHPSCAVCGRSKELSVHHKQPFHLFPHRELDPVNLITLCESAGMNCHITFGHLGNFKSYNETIEDDVPIWKLKIQNRP